MSIVPDHLPSTASPIPNRKETVSLQVEKANLEREIEALRNESNFLDSFRNKAAKLILKSDEKKIIQLEEKVRDYLQKLRLKEKLEAQIQELNVQKDEAKEDVTGLNQKIIETKLELSQLESKTAEQKKLVESGLAEAQQQLNKVRQEIIEAQAIRRQTLEEAEVERAKIEEAWKEVKAAERNLMDKENALLRKQRDLTIYERRVEKQFKIAFPNQEMKFI